MRLLQWSQRVEEVQFAVVERLPKLREEQAPKQSRQHPHGQEEAWPAGDPALAVERHAAAGHDTVQVRVMHQSLAPGVQHGDEADLGAQVLGIGGDRAQGLGGGAEQDVVDDGLVLVGDRRDLLRHGEDDVEVLDRQELGLPLNAMRWWPQASHCSRWPPSAAVRQRSMSVMTRRCPRLSESACWSR